MRAKLFVTEALGSIRSNFSTSIAAVMTVLIGMFLLGLFVVLGSWVLSWTNNVKDDLVVNVYFCTYQTCEKDATQQQMDAVANRLNDHPDVKSFEFISKDEAWEIMQERYPELTENTPRNPLPASFKAVPSDAQQVQELAASLEPLPAGVEKVDYGEEKADRVLHWAYIIGGTVLFGSIVLLVSSVILIANTIRLSIFSRRHEIEVMKLVGATNWFVRAPFMLEGLLCGLVGSLLAVTLLFTADRLALSRVLGGDDGAEPWAFPLVAGLMVGISLLVGAAGSGITMRRFLRI
jgi:cell division transport system permease protein